MRPSRATRSLLPLALAGAILAAGLDSARAVEIGLSEQNAAMFDSPAWQDLQLKRVRYIVPWDWSATGQAGEVSAFMTRARAAGQDVLVAFTASRGCFDGRRYARTRSCSAPSTGAYRRAFRAFDDAYPWVRTYSVWNEANHVSQPTYRAPRTAARYYNIVRSECRRRDCRVLAADVLDTSNMRSWLTEFKRHAAGSPRLWGLHNYQDVNRGTTTDTRRMLRTVRGEVWLTETGGIVQFAGSRGFEYDEARAERSLRRVFRLADRYDTRRPGLRSRITRLYVYRWFGEQPGARFDAGLVKADGTPRAGLETFAQHVRR